MVCISRRGSSMKSGGNDIWDMVLLLAIAAAWTVCVTIPILMKLTDRILPPEQCDRLVSWMKEQWLR